MCALLCALKDRLSQRRVTLHGCGDQGGEERQVPDGRSIRNRHLFTLGNLIAKCLQAVNASVASVTQAPLNVDLDVWGWGDNAVSTLMEHVNTIFHYHLLQGLGPT